MDPMIGPTRVPAAVARRRVYFFSAVFVLTSLAALMMTDFLWRTGMDELKTAIVIVYTLLFSQIAYGFCQAIFGASVLLRGPDPLRITATLEGNEKVPLGRTAVVLPIYNEDASRVFEGLRSVYRSVEATGELEAFDFFVLSDSTDPNHWIEEETLWVQTCKDLGATGRVFYRKRRSNVNQKSGNIADFCRRWGDLYPYMMVLDADSVMTGSALVKLGRLMEVNPRVGIVQTAPTTVRGGSRFSRMMQFANRLYGPIFQAGQNFWQQGHGNYIGHNAIVRMEPFIQYCGLPGLPGGGPLGGKILSHDFVEAALMRKAGYAVWLACDLEGSYEHGPQTLIDYAKRDRRWCQGNMQHTWMLVARGFNAASRIHFFVGIMSYLSSLFWLLFLGLSTLSIYSHEQTGLSLIPTPGFTGFLHLTLVQHGLLLFAATMTILLLPKWLALLLAARSAETRRSFGGFPRMAGGLFYETAISTLVAPIMMLFHSKFILWILLGRGVSWAAQKRGGEGTTWREAAGTHASHTLVGVAWAGLAWWLDPVLLVWLSPLLFGLIGSIPFSVWVSRPRVSRLFQVPEEINPPAELLALDTAEVPPHLPLGEANPSAGLVHAALDPFANAVHISLLRERRSPTPETAVYLAGLRSRFLGEGPESLNSQERTSLLLDGDSMLTLHRELWRFSKDALPGWCQPIFPQYIRLWHLGS